MANRKKFKVLVKEIMFHEFTFEAENADEAKEKYGKAVSRGELDFSDGDLIELEIIDVTEE